MSVHHFLLKNFPFSTILSEQNYTRTNKIMSNTPIPSVEVVYKWSPKDVIIFLESKKDELFLRDQDIKIIEDN